MIGCPYQTGQNSPLNLATLNKLSFLEVCCPPALLISVGFLGPEHIMKYAWKSMVMKQFICVNLLIASVKGLAKAVFVLLAK